MPRRWWVGVSGVAPERVRLEHLHAAVSSWFDHSQGQHDSLTKPYAISPLGRSADDSELGFEVSTLTGEALDRLNERCDPGATIRLGGQLGSLAHPALLAEESWESLAEPSGDREWTLDFVTPVTFRRGNRSSPLPVASSALRGLSESWRSCSGLAAKALTPQESDRIWVSHLAGQSETLTVSKVQLSGFVGQVRFRCDDDRLSDRVDGLFRLAPYSGVGSFKAKGLGVARLLTATRVRRRVS